MVVVVMAQRIEGGSEVKEEEREEGVEIVPPS